MLKQHTFDLFYNMKSVKILWIPCLIPLPLLFIWQELFVRLELFALLIPVTVFLHEWLHLLLIPHDAPVTICSSWYQIFLKVEETNQPLLALMAALAPSLVLSGIGLLVARSNLLFALPFLLQIVSLPLDLWGWYRGVIHNGCA